MARVTGSPKKFPPEALEHYNRGEEQQRLFSGTFKLELARTQEILQRYLPPPPAVIFDVGGGPGVYANWLAQMGYEVYLIDPVPLHIKQAQEVSQKQPDFPLAGAIVGEAEKLNRKNNSVDVVILLGPLYHLTERRDRLAVLREARRVLREGGILFAAIISRFASAIDGLFRDLMDDPEFVRILQRDLKDGQHRNPGNHPFYFTTAYFHLPEEIKEEIAEVGLRHEKTLPVESIGCMLQNFEEHWENPERQNRLLNLIRSLEDEPSLLGTSAHILAIARKVS